MVFFLIPSPIVSELSLLNCLPILLRADGVKQDKGDISARLPCSGSQPQLPLSTYILQLHISRHQRLEL